MPVGSLRPTGLGAIRKIRSGEPADRLSGQSRLHGQFDYRQLGADGFRIFRRTPFRRPRHQRTNFRRNAGALPAGRHRTVARSRRHHGGHERPGPEQRLHRIGKYLGQHRLDVRTGQAPQNPADPLFRTARLPVRLATGSSGGRPDHRVERNDRAVRPGKRHLLCRLPLRPEGRTERPAGEIQRRRRTPQSGVLQNHGSDRFARYRQKTGKKSRRPYRRREKA